MPTAPHDARVLFQVAPDQYVAERTRLVKEARAARDKDAVAFYQSLKRPNLSLWAVLAAADDADTVRSVVATTTELGEIQAGGGKPDALAKATKGRRDLLETLTDRAVAALAQSDKSASARRAEIRALVDQLSRQPADTDAWIDGTLRDVGDASLGFAAFAEMPVTESERRPRPEKKPKPAKVATATPARKPAAERSDPAKVREARRALDVAARDLASTERRVQAARRAVDEAEASLRSAEKDAALAQRQHERAAARLEAVRHG